MQRQFHPFGFVSRVIIDRDCGQGLVSFDTIDAATYAFENMRGRYVLGRKLLVSIFVVVYDRNSFPPSFQNAKFSWICPLCLTTAECLVILG